MLHTKDTNTKHYRLKAKPLMKFKMTLTLVDNYGIGRYIHPEVDGPLLTLISLKISVL